MARRGKWTAMVVLLAVPLVLFAPASHAGPELPASYAGQDAEHWYELVSGLSGGGLGVLDGQRFSFAVDLEDGENFSLQVDAKDGKVAATYRLAGNKVAAPWARAPDTEPARAGHEPFLFLPLKSVAEEKDPEMIEFDPGKPVEVRSLWRDDYLLAFDNIKDFLPGAGDDASLRAEFPLTGTVPPTREGVRMLALCRLKAPYFAQGEAVWKASAAQPARLTVRKRYLVAELLEVEFYDYARGEVLAKIVPTRR